MPPGFSPAIGGAARMIMHRRDARDLPGRQAAAGLPSSQVADYLDHLDQVP
jgi:hypothetical protein